MCRLPFVMYNLHDPSSYIFYIFYNHNRCDAYLHLNRRRCECCRRAIAGPLSLLVLPYCRCSPYASLPSCCLPIAPPPQLVLHLRRYPCLAPPPLHCNRPIEHEHRSATADGTAISVLSIVGGCFWKAILTY